MKKIIFCWLVFLLPGFILAAPPKISGHLTGIAGRTLNNSSGTVSNLLTDYYLALDWEFSPFPEVSGFARAAMSEDNYLLLEQAGLQFFPDKLLAVKGFYQQKTMFLSDPLKILYQPVSLKYERVEFFDEFNENKFRGQFDQGLVLSARISENTSLNIFYSDLLNPTTYYQAGEDNLGGRLEQKFSGLPLKIGLNGVWRRGIHWPYAENNDWFPDPESRAGYSFNSSSRSAASVWYKGYLEQNFFSVDGVFNFTRDVRLWIESGQQTENLSAVLKTGNVSTDKEWSISKKDIAAAGLKTRLHHFQWELNYHNERQDFRRPDQNSGYPLEKNTFGFIARYDFNPAGFIGLSAKKFVLTRDLNEDIPAYIHPLRQDYFNILPASFNPYFSLMVPAEEGQLEFHCQKGILMLDLLAAIESGKTLTTDYDADGILSSVNLLDDYRKNECLLNLKLKIVANFYWENAARLINYLWSAREKTFFNNYTAVSWRLTDSLFFRLGYGVDPDDWRDDIRLGFDRRMLFLYNLVSSGQDLIRAEDEMAREQCLTFRTEIKF